MTKRDVIRELVLIGLHSISLVYLAFVWQDLPDEVPVHFNIHGEADDWTSKMGLLYILLGYNGGLYLLFLIIPKLAAKKFLKDKPLVFKKLRVGLTIIFASIGFLLVYMSIGDPKIGILCLALVFALLSIMLGNYLQTVKPNYFIGIRTPWTLENEEVWKKTHRIGGKLMFWGGIISLPIIFLLPMEYSPFPPVAALVLSSVYTMIYSYIEFKKQNNSEVKEG